MKHFKIGGLCLAALFALGVATSASAGATELPAIYECAKAPKVGKTYTGHYSSKTCSPASYVEAGGQKYEFQPWDKAAGKAKAFKGKGGDANLEIVGVGGVTCTKSASTGYFTGPKTVGKVTVVFTGCELNGHTCQGAAPKASKSGEVITNALSGEIGYINKAKVEVGVVLKPETALYFGEFNCGELKFRTGGAVIGKVSSPANEMTKEVALSFTESSGKQHPEMFEGGTPQVLYSEEGGKGEWPEGGTEHHQSGESTTVTGKGEELELVA